MALSSSSPLSNSRNIQVLDLIADIRGYTGNFRRRTASKYWRRLLKRHSWLANVATTEQNKPVVPFEVALGLVLKCDGELDAENREALARTLCRASRASEHDFEAARARAMKLEFGVASEAKSGAGEEASDNDSMESHQTPDPSTTSEPRRRRKRPRTCHTDVTVSGDDDDTASQAVCRMDRIEDTLAAIQDEIALQTSTLREQSSAIADLKTLLETYKNERLDNIDVVNDGIKRMLEGVARSGDELKGRVDELTTLVKECSSNGVALPIMSEAPSEAEAAELMQLKAAEERRRTAEYELKKAQTERKMLQESLRMFVRVGARYAVPRVLRPLQPKQQVEKWMYLPPVSMGDDLRAHLRRCMVTFVTLEMMPLDNGCIYFYPASMDEPGLGVAEMFTADCEQHVNCLLQAVYNDLRDDAFFKMRFLAKASVDEGKFTFADMPLEQFAFVSTFGLTASIHAACNACRDLSSVQAAIDALSRRRLELLGGF